MFSFTKHTNGISACVVAAVATMSCSSEPLDSSGQEVICYRGQVVVAEKVNGRYYVDFDLEATAQEQWCPGETSSAPSAPGVAPQGRRAPADPGSVWSTSIYGDHWPGGVVPYVIDAGFTSTESAAIVAAMVDWERAVTKLDFRAKTGSDTSWVSFVPDTVCSSGYGRLTGARTIRLTSGCTASFSVHHEIGHALGLQHEHTRADRDNYVTVSSSSANYQIDSGADMFSYDFDSIMHYSLGGVISLAPGVSVPAGVTVGQRNHLSATDIATVWAMYPDAAIHSPLFANTGAQRLCRLTGREDDIENQFETISAQAGLDGDEFADTDALSPGDYAVDCSVKTLFWSRDYDYPNSSFFEGIDSLNEHEAQNYEASATVRVLNAGLIPILLN
jgi:hypothetical protein